MQTWLQLLPVKKRNTTLLSEQAGYYLAPSIGKRGSLKLCSWMDAALFVVRGDRVAGTQALDLSESRGARFHP